MTTQSQPQPLDAQSVRRMYRRVLAGWARDALTLRRAGLDRPGARWRKPRRRAA